MRQGPNQEVPTFVHPGLGSGLWEGQEWAAGPALTLVWRWSLAQGRIEPEAMDLLLPSSSLPGVPTSALEFKATFTFDS